MWLIIMLKWYESRRAAFSFSNVWHTHFVSAVAFVPFDVRILVQIQAWVAKRCWNFHRTVAYK